jgi:hypothetical protein
MIHLVSMGNPSTPELVPDERATEPILLLAMGVTRIAGAGLISARCGRQKEATVELSEEKAEANQHRRS